MSFYKVKNYETVNFWYVLRGNIHKKSGQGKGGSKLPWAPKFVSQPPPSHTTREIDTEEKERGLGRLDKIQKWPNHKLHKYLDR